MRVLIIGDSIEENENVGATVTNIQPRREPPFIGLSLPANNPLSIDATIKKLEELKLLVTSYAMTSSYEESECCYEISCIYNDSVVEDTIERLQDAIKSMGIVWLGMEIKTPITTISHAPIPRYSYEYNNEFMADCPSCTARFPFNKRGMPYEYGDYDLDESDVCPFCHEDLEVERETITEAIERVGFTK